MDGWTEMVLAFERRIRRPLLDASYLLAFVIASHLTANLDSKLHETKDPADHDLQDVIDQVKLEEC